MIQSESHTPRHEAALDQLAAAGRLYPVRVQPRRSRGLGRRAPDGGWAYDNTCRGRPLGDWRAQTRAAPPARSMTSTSCSSTTAAVDLSQTPARDMGDPIVRRRDGVIAYQLAVVVDDAARGDHRHHPRRATSRRRPRRR